MQSSNYKRFSESTFVVSIGILLAAIDLNRSAAELPQNFVVLFNFFAAFFVFFGLFFRALCVDLKQLSRVRLASIILSGLLVLSTLNNLDYWYADKRIDINSWFFVLLTILVVFLIAQDIDAKRFIFNAGSVWIFFSVLLYFFGLEKIQLSIDEQDRGGAADFQSALVNSKNLYGVFLILWLTCIPFASIKKLLIPFFIYYFYYLDLKSVFICGVVLYLFVAFPSMSQYFFRSKAFRISIIGLSIFLIPFVSVHGDLLGSTSPWGGLNGRQLIWHESMNSLSTDNLTAALFGEGIFGHVPANAYSFAYIFADPDKIHLLHNTLLQLVFDVGIVGLGCWLYLLNRTIRVGGEIGLAGFFCLVLGTVEVIVAPYFPFAFLFVMLAGNKRSGQK